MKTIRSIIAIAVCSLFVSCTISIGSNNIVKQERNVKGFDAIRVSHGIDIELSRGDFNVVAEANDNLIDVLETEVSGNTLLVFVDKSRIKNAHLKVYITAPDIRKINASSSSDVKLINPMKSSSELSFEASSSASIEGEVDAPEISISVSSSGEVNLKGNCRNLNLGASSSGEIDAEDLKAENVIADVSSAGSVNTYASVSLKANASSAGEIRYKGGSKKNSIKTSSAGSVKSN